MNQMVVVLCAAVKLVGVRYTLYFHSYILCTPNTRRNDNYAKYSKRGSNTRFHGQLSQLRWFKSNHQSTNWCGRVWWSAQQSYYFLEPLDSLEVLFIRQFASKLPYPTPIKTFNNSFFHCMNDVSSSTSDRLHDFPL